MHDYKEFIRPKTIIEFRKGIKLHLEGLDRDEMYALESMKLRTFDSKEEVDRTSIAYGRLYSSRTIKKIEGFSIGGVPFEIKFTDATKFEMTIESWAVIDKLLTQKLKVDYYHYVEKFANECHTKGLDDVTFDEDNDKKKD